jgi:hypothetical protein
VQFNKLPEAGVPNVGVFKVGLFSVSPEIVGNDPPNKTGFAPIVIGVAKLLSNSESGIGAVAPVNVYGTVIKLPV